MTNDANGIAPVQLTTEAIDVGSLLTAVQQRSTGAVSMFLGTVRDFNDGRPVTGIDYDAYGAMAEQEMTRIHEEVTRNVPDLTLRIVHRTGTLTVGDISVAIAASHPHRQAAIDATSRTIEELKQRVPIWKLEHYVDGERRWVDPTAGASS